jgi:outer membrane protein assembly factor BamE (lipoprotein component of BamABCDE complex)
MLSTSTVLQKTFTIVGTSILILICAAGCSTDRNSQMGFDTDAWKEDKNGCLGKREEMLAQFDKSKDQLMGMRERELLQILGRPDKQDLHKRNQKFYIYYVQPGNQCEESNALVPGRILRMRFSALDLVNEISYENFN